MDGQQIILLQLSLNDVNTILQGLLEMPARMAMGAITRVQQQAQSQTRPDGQAPDAPPLQDPPPTPAEIVDRREKAEAAAKAAATPPNRAARRRAAKK
jgi:hypothetical protein